MLKIVVFDSGYGGELFADCLQAELPIVEIIRVIAWRNADEILTNPRAARQIAKEALRAYFGKVDLIIFANYLLSLTSLKYFQRKYKNQKFIGLSLKVPADSNNRHALILSTKAVSRTINYYNYVFRLHRPFRTLNLDTWPNLIDDGELTQSAIQDAIKSFLISESNFAPQDIILASSQFSDIRENLKAILGHNVKIHDGFSDTIRLACKTLRIRGGIGKKKK